MKKSNLVFQSIDLRVRVHGVASTFADQLHVTLASDSSPLFQREKGRVQPNWNKNWDATEPKMDPKIVPKQDHFWSPNDLVTEVRTPTFLGPKVSKTGPETGPKTGLKIGSELDPIRLRAHPLFSRWKRGYNILGLQLNFSKVLSAGVLLVL